MEREGCAPADLRAGIDAVYGDRSSASLAWRAALTFGEVAFARGCEFALEDREEFDESQHLTPEER